MIPVLESDQETVLEGLMQHSFGAQNFYVPIRYKQGSSENEPCDLMWCNGQDVVLFYLTAGKKSLNLQDAHNLKQATKWIKRWSSTGKPLKAKNRFDDVVELHFQSARSVSTISIISHLTGAVFHPSPRSVKNGFTCTVPESLIHAIAAFNGTVIDLLWVLDNYTNNISRVLLSHGRTGPDRLANSLCQLLENQKIVRARLHTEVDNTDDLSFVLNLLGINRLPAPLGSELIKSLEGREQVVKYFGDMSACDFLLLSAACVATIKKTENQRLTVYARTQGMYLDWNIVATNFGARNSAELFAKFMESIKTTPYEHCPTIIFGYALEGMDYRGPSMYALQPKKVKSQAGFLITKISTHIRQAQKMRSVMSSAVSKKRWGHMPKSE